jgi:c-di-GMP-binding flagellar brake protein YcgR
MESRAAPEQQSASERRSHERLRIKLYGRFMLEDQTEHACAVEDISTGNLSVRADHIGEPGEKVIVYLDQIGRLEGVITRTDIGGFALTIVASDRKREKLAAQISWLNNRDKHGSIEDRRHERIAPRNPMSVLHMSDGRKYQCRIIDLSLSGAAIEIDVKPAMGTPVVLGSMHGQIVRHFEEGVAIQFASIQAADTLEQNFNKPPSASAA